MMLHRFVLVTNITSCFTILRLWFLDLCIFIVFVVAVGRWSPRPKNYCILLLNLAVRWGSNRILIRNVIAFRIPHSVYLDFTLRLMMVVRWNICKLVYLQSTWTIRQFSGTFVVNKSIAEWSKRWNDTFSHSIFENVTNKLTIECPICTRIFFFLPSFPEWLCDKRTRTHQLATNALLLGRMESVKPFLLNEFKVWNRFGRPLTMTMTTAGDNHSKMKNDSQVHIFRFQFSHVETWMMVPCRAAETKCVFCVCI